MKQPHQSSLWQRILLAILFLTSVPQLWAYDFVADGIYYNKLSDSACEVTYKNIIYDSYSGAVAIPESVTYSGTTYTVTSIGNTAFRNCARLTSVTIPNSVISIGYAAFYECSGLTSVIIPNSVTSIADYAFASCSGLTSVTIGSSVTSIGNCAFYYSNFLHYIISLATTPPDIESSAFSDYKVPLIAASEDYKTADGWQNFTNITVANAGLIGDICYNISENVATIIKYGETATTLTIPSEIMYNNHTYSVTSIGASAFKDNTVLTSVSIPNSVTSIGDNAFYGCTGLTSITIPNSVTSIGDYAFYGCTGLTSITIPNSVTSIGKSAFAYCSGLTSVSIPDPVTSISSQAFYKCTGLTSVTISNSVNSIGDYAFYKCSD